MAHMARSHHTHSTCNAIAGHKHSTSVRHLAKAIPQTTRPIIANRGDTTTCGKEYLPSHLHTPAYKQRQSHYLRLQVAAAWSGGFGMWFSCLTYQLLLNGSPIVAAVRAPPVAHTNLPPTPWCTARCVVVIIPMKVDIVAVSVTAPGPVAAVAAVVVIRAVEV